MHRWLRYGAVALLALVTFQPNSVTPQAARAATPPTPIQHIVVIYQENHSFDETLGYWCNTFTPARCDGYTGAVTLKDGTVVSLHQSPDVVPPVAHQVGPQLAAMDGGKMDGWALLAGCSASRGYGCLTYYTPAQIPNLTALATKFTVADRFFSEQDSPSFGGHLYAVAATTDGFTGANPHRSPTVSPKPGWGCDSNRDSMWIDPSSHVGSMQPSCIPDPALPGIANGGAYRATPAQYVPTIMDRMDAAGISWRMYAANSSQPGNYVWATCPSFAECLYGPQHVNVVPTDTILTDATKGTLPNFSLVLPGGGQASGASQHNQSSMLVGDNWIGKVVSAIENGPDWSSTAIFITYDDCGCFYDHVSPAKNPDGTKQGPRVPMVIVSPYAKPAFTDSTPATFASILAYEEYVFGLPALGANDAAAYRFTNSFDYSQVPLARVQTFQSKIPPGKTVDVVDDPT